MSRFNPSKMDVCRTSSEKFSNFHYFLTAYDPEGLTAKVLDGYTDILIKVHVDYTRYRSTSCCNINQFQKTKKPKKRYPWSIKYYMYLL